MSLEIDIEGINQGLAYLGQVTAVPGANQFTCPALAGFGATAFVGSTAFVLWDAGGAAAAPQGESQLVTVYDSLTGIFTTAAFTAAVGIGDKVLILHSAIADIFTMLKLRRSAQSGNKVLNGAMTAIYAQGSTTDPFIFSGGDIDLTPMQAGDTVIIRTRKQLDNTATWIVADQMTYNDAQPATHLLAHIDACPNQYNFEIAIQQTAGAFRTLACAFYEAMK